MAATLCSGPRKAGSAQRVSLHPQMHRTLATSGSSVRGQCGSSGTLQAPSQARRWSCDALRTRRTGYSRAPDATGADQPLAPSPTRGLQGQSRFVRPRAHFFDGKGTVAQSRLPWPSVGMAGHASPRRQGDGARCQTVDAESEMHRSRRRLKGSASRSSRTAHGVRQLVQSSCPNRDRAWG